MNDKYEIPNIYSISQIRMMRDIEEKLMSIPDQDTKLQIKSFIDTYFIITEKNKKIFKDRKYNVKKTLINLDKYISKDMDEYITQFKSPINKDELNINTNTCDENKTNVIDSYIECILDRYNKKNTKKSNYKLN